MESLEINSVTVSDLVLHRSGVGGLYEIIFATRGRPLLTDGIELSTAAGTLAAVASAFSTQIAIIGAFSLKYTTWDGKPQPLMVRLISNPLNYKSYASHRGNG